MSNATLILGKAGQGSDNPTALRPELRLMSMDDGPFALAVHVPEMENVQQQNATLIQQNITLIEQGGTIISNQATIIALLQTGIGVNVLSGNAGGLL